MAKSFIKPTRLTTRIEKATLVGIELLHPNLGGELAPILCRQLLDSVQHSMPNDKVTESDLLIALNKLYRKGLNRVPNTGFPGRWQSEVHGTWK